MSNTTSDDLLSVEQVAALLQIQRHTLMNWRSAGKGPPAFRVGRSLRYRRSAVDQWIAEQEQMEQAR